MRALPYRTYVRIVTERSDNYQKQEESASAAASRLRKSRVMTIACDPIGYIATGYEATAVRNLGVDGNVVTFAGLDLLDGTPVLDIKPWFADCDQPDAL